MFAGFKLSLTKDQLSEFRDSEKIEDDEVQEETKRVLNDFLLGDGSIDGSSLQDNWFPHIKADVFISHSHQDENMALSMANWLKQTFGLISFIDSYVWGYCNDLLKQIDDKHCFRKEDMMYDYNLRNYSTSHVHMMLSTALTTMMDQTETLFFLNTPNSITTEQSINKTRSPWIYHELVTSEKLRKRVAPAHRTYSERDIRKSFVLESVNVKYDAPLNHLLELSKSELDSWTKQYDRKSNDHPLDVLYQLKSELSLQVL